MSRLRVGLLGVGTVGSSVARALTTRREQLAAAAGAELVLTRAVVRDLKKARDIPAQLLSTDADALVAADDVDLVVELMGGEEPCRTLIDKALSNGKHVVTANKRVLAWHGDGLFAKAAAKNVALRYEAAVCGGLPVIASLADDLAANDIHELRGIINGTTNFIVTAMAAGGSYADTLAEAQKRGFAEADPSADVDGIDAADKLAILVRLAFGAAITPRKIFREGISKLDVRDIALGRELGYTLKLLGMARLAEKGVEARVHPVFLPTSHPLARVDGALNAVQVIGDLCGPIMFSGQGAGGDATASAVLADMIHVARGARNTTRATRDLPILPMGEARTRCYFRIAVDDVPGVFAKITQVLADHAIGLASVLQREPPQAGGAEIVLLTYSAPEAALAAAEVALAKLSCTRSVVARIRVDAPDEHRHA
ncbi:MAG: homoserine dehydrogenase [Myxococcota bacterium]|nr:homoserine dehydrogenase [Myxococcota bacterium]